MLSDKKPNRLINETSPYLIQHAHNPVDWYPWGEEAFEKAKSEDKPIFLSIGYSTCHWCHVMEEESFKDYEVADFLNRHFVAIKVDREERPDVDSVYMGVCHALTGSGGWPLTVVLTPEQKPFFAGTYFPKKSQYGRTGLVELLQNIVEMWRDKRDKLLTNASNITEIIKREHEKIQSVEDKSIPEKTFRYLSRSFDEAYGGFSGAPKFPTPHNLLFLIEYYKLTKAKDALRMVEKTLKCMYGGGIFDHIGGGFSRYSTDRLWLIPHFEKMLYDNALLLSAYSKCYAVTKNALYKDVAKKICKYVSRDMTNTSGAFYSAEDADVEGEEGLFYGFAPDEVIGVLGGAGETFNLKFGITEHGNFEGRNIPNLIYSRTDKEINEESIEKLYEFRKKRYKLAKDDKILTSWNCLMISSLCDAYLAFGNKEYIAAAEKAYMAINDINTKDGSIFTSSHSGRLKPHGVLDDYAFYIYSCIRLYQATLNELYVEKAKEILKKALDIFADPKGGFFLSKESERLILRPKETYDGAIPSGNSVMAYCLVWLAHFTEEEWIIEEKNKQLKFMSGSYNAGGNSFFALSPLLEANINTVVCATENVKDGDVARDRFSEFDIVKLIKPTANYPLLKNKTTYYVCKVNSCRPPNNDITSL